MDLGFGIPRIPNFQLYLENFVSLSILSFTNNNLVQKIWVIKSGCLCLISFGLSDEFSHSQGPNKVYFGKKRMIPKNWYRGLALAYYMIEEEYIVLIWDVQIK